jgi:hypothetical protein
MRLPRARVAAADKALATRPPPAPIAGFENHLSRHERSTKDAALNHVAETLTRLLGSGAKSGAMSASASMNACPA